MCNPFSSQRIRPQIDRFVESQPGSLAAVVNRISSSPFSGQIVGPHGSGKSTLALNLLPHLSNRITQCRLVTIRIQPESACLRVQSEAIRIPICASPDGSEQMMILDGIECLSRLNRFLLVQNCRANNTHLLVTTHRKLWGLPVLAHLKPDPLHFRAIVADLLKEHPVELENLVIDKAFHHQKGDYREALMELFDVVQGTRQTKNVLQK